MSEAARTPSIRTVLALVATGVVVLVAAVTAIVVVAVRNAPATAPELTAYAHGRTITVSPFAYCAVTMRDCRVLPSDPADIANTVFAGLPCESTDTDCRTGDTATLAVPPGYPLQLSLPRAVAGAPWLAQLVYTTAEGERVDRVISHNDYPADTPALTLDSRPEPDLRLIGVELQLPILARDETGQEFYVPHAAWSISTAAA